MTQKTDISDFQDFSFNELVDFIRDVQRTSKITSANYYENQDSFVSIDLLKEKMDLVAQELARRIQKAWHIEKITSGGTNGMSLPSALMNMGSIQPSTVVQEVIKQEPQIGAIENANGEEEIFFRFNNRRYIMGENGGISMEEIGAK